MVESKIYDNDEFNRERLKGRPTAQLRRGKIRLNRDQLMWVENEATLKALFCNFYPIAIEPLHEADFYSSITYYGISPLFREVPFDEIMPEYIAEFKFEGGETTLVRMMEVKQ